MDQLQQRRARRVRYDAIPSPAQSRFAMCATGGRSDPARPFYGHLRHRAPEHASNLRNAIGSVSPPYLQVAKDQLKAALGTLRRTGNLI